MWRQEAGEDGTKEKLLCGLLPLSNARGRASSGSRGVSVYVTCPRGREPREGEGKQALVHTHTLGTELNTNMIIIIHRVGGYNMTPLVLARPRAIRPSLCYV